MMSGLKRIVGERIRNAGSQSLENYRLGRRKRRVERN